MSLFCFFHSTLRVKIGRRPGNTSEDPKSKTCSFYGTILFKSQMLTCFGRIWRPVNILKCPMKKLQNGSKTHFFSYCLSFRRWPAKSKAAGGVININLLFLYRISISKNFFMMLRQVFWICYRFREPPLFSRKQGRGGSWFTIICSCNVLRRTLWFSKNKLTKHHYTNSYLYSKKLSDNCLSFAKNSS